MKLNPFFEIDGKRYEIKRTRYLEAEYEKLSKQNNFSDDQQVEISRLTKLRMEYDELAERFRNAKEKYFDNVTNKEAKEQYLAFKEISSEAYDNLVAFEIKHKDVSLDSLQKIAIDKAEQLLIKALEEQYSLNIETAQAVWGKYVDKIGVQNASEWVLYFVNTLFNNEEDDAFLSQAKAREEQKLNQRRGLEKIKK